MISSKTIESKIRKNVANEAFCNDLSFTIEDSCLSIDMHGFSYSWDLSNFTKVSDAVSTISSSLIDIYNNVSNNVLVRLVSKPSNSKVKKLGQYAEFYNKFTGIPYLEEELSKNFKTKKEILVKAVHYLLKEIILTGLFELIADNSSIELASLANDTIKILANMQFISSNSNIDVSGVLFCATVFDIIADKKSEDLIIIPLKNHVFLVDSFSNCWRYGVTNKTDVKKRLNDLKDLLIDTGNTEVFYRYKYRTASLEIF